MTDTFGQRLARFRKARGMTQAALAAQVGTHPGYIPLLEGGHRANPSMDLCIKLADALHVSLDDLVRGTSPNALISLTEAPDAAPVAGAA